MGSSAASTAFRWSVISTAWLVLGSVALACVPSRVSADSEEATALPFYSTPDFTAEWVEPGSREERDLHRIAPFSFADQDGAQVTRESLSGKIYVANFFLTSCPSVCPKMTATFKRIQRAFDGDSGVELVSHTVDPETDTQQRLASYAQQNGATSGKWVPAA